MIQTAGLIVSGIVYCLGERHDIRELAGALTVDAMAGLVEQGLQGFSTLNCPLAYAMETCISESLQTSGLEPADIDAVVLATESFDVLFEDQCRSETSGFSHTADQLFVFLHDLGFRRTSLHCASLGGCANLLQAFIFAEALIEKGLSRHVLIVAGEKRAPLQTRLMHSAVSLASDGAVSCLLSKGLRANSTAFQLDYVGITPYAQASANNPEKPDAVLAMFRAMRNAAADCYEARGIGPADFRWIITGDYNIVTSITHGKLLGFSPEHVFMNNVGKFGHVPCDPLMNLANLAIEGLIESSDRVLLFLTGPIFCGPIAVTVIHG